MPNNLLSGDASLDIAGPRSDRAFTATTWGRALGKATHFALALLGLAIVIQAFIVVQARPQDLVIGVYGMADLIRRAMPPNFSFAAIIVWVADWTSGGRRYTALADLNRKDCRST